MRRIIAAVTCLALAITGLAISPASTTEIKQAVASVTASSVATARPATFPANVQNSTRADLIKSVSCSSPGNCVAVGDFKTAESRQEAFMQTQTNGTWGDAIPITFDSGVAFASPAATYNSVSCPADGECVAVGSFMNAAAATEAFTQTRTNGIWANPIPATFDAGIQNATPTDKFSSVSCSSAGNCTAVGQFRNPRGGFKYGAFTQTLTNGVWANSVPTVFAAFYENNNSDTQLVSVSCSATDNCTAVGYLTNSANVVEGFTQTQTNGTWSNAVIATFSGGMLSASAPRSVLASVSCSSPGNCTAGGSFRDTSGGIVAFTQTQTNGTWGNGVPATFDSGAKGSTSNDGLASISCTSAGNCTAVGSFLNAAVRVEAFTLTQTNGTWANAVPATFDSGIQSTTPFAYLSSVSCISAGNCVAAGRFQNTAGGAEAFTQTQTNGTWANGVPASFDTGVQNISRSAGFTSVSCPSSTGTITPTVSAMSLADDCMAGGMFKNASGGNEAFTQDFSTASPTPTPTPTASPSASPTTTPSASPTPTPSASPSGSPSSTPTPTTSPTTSPTTTPSAKPTVKSLKVTVVFGERSAKLTTTEKKKLLKAIATAGSKVSSGTVVGYVQREGYSANDVKLSAARAKVVAQFLSANGVKVRLVSMGKGALDSSTASRKAVLNLRYAK